jgi:WD40 repeat protein
VLTALTPDGKFGAGHGKDGAVVWDVAGGKIRAACKGGHTAPLSAVSLSPDGGKVVTGSEDKTARLWDAKTGEELAVLKGHTLTVASAEFSPDGKQVVTGSYTGEIKVWEVASGKELYELRGMSTSNNPSMFSKDGGLIVSPRFNTPAVWSTKDRKLIQEFKGHASWVRTARLDAAGTRIVTAGLDKTARVWSVKTGKELCTLGKHPEEVAYAAFSPDGSRAVTLSGGVVRIWEVPADK